MNDIRPSEQLQKDALGLLTTGAQASIFLAKDLKTHDAQNFTRKVTQLVNALTARLNETMREKDAEKKCFY